MKKRICALFLAVCLLLSLCGDLRSLAYEATDSVVGKQVKIAPGASMVWPLTSLTNGSTIIAGVSEYAEVMIVTAVGTVNGTTYYQLKVADGYSWPANSKVQDGYWLDSSKLEVIVTEESCPVCGETDCSAVHFWCERCGAYDCGNDHLVCPACGEIDCNQTHIFCGYCNDYDCGESHDFAPVVTPVVPVNPDLTGGVDVSIVDEYGDVVVGNYALFAGMKTSLSAWTDLEGDLSYQWQIWADDQWVDIRGQIGQGILVSPAMLLNAAVNNVATIRCEVTNGVEVRTSEEIAVVVENAPVAASFAMGSSASAQADDVPELHKVNLILEYRFTNNTVAANPWTAELTPGKPVGQKVKLPVVPGYMPTVDKNMVKPEDAEIVDENGVYYMQLKYVNGISEDTTLNVTYQPIPVTVTVLHYWQNVDNDNYVLHETTTRQLLTGSTVVDVHENYPGFYNLLYEKPVVAADGSTVVRVYYDRYYYLMKFDLSGGFGIDPIYIRYGAAVGFIPTPTRPGYDFDRWQLNGVDTEIPATMPAENRTYTAVWSNPKSVNYTVVYWRENADDNNYSIWGSVPKQATAGTTVSGDNDVPTSITNTTINGATVNEKKYFTYNGALTDKNVVVNGDGSTTVNVYYTRNYYTLYFTGVSGKCVLEEHTHSDGTCDKPLLCHMHDNTCESELTCTTPEHMHGSSCCSLDEHVHTDACYTCTVHTAHVRSCYQFSGGASISNNAVTSNSTIRNLNNQTPNAYGIVTYDSVRYVKLGDKWYKINDYENRTTVTLTCGGFHSHGDGNCTYKDTEHTHGDANCNCDQTAHTHDSSCYEWQCLQGHEHTDACYRACIKYVHTHSNNCNNNRTDNVIYVIHAKYNAYIGDVWPTASIISGLSYWTGTGVGNQSSKLMNMVSAICIDGGNTFTYHTNNTAYQLNYMFESFDQTSAANGTTRILKDGIYYDISTGPTGYSQIAYYSGTISGWGYKSISGLTPAYSDDAKKDSNNTFWLYYKRDRKEIHFVNTHTGDDDPLVKTVTGVMYGQPLANYADNGVLLSATTAPYPSGLPALAYEFDSWYTTPEGYEETKFDFTTGTMPDGDLYLYAKWVPITRTIRFFLDRSDFEKGTTIPEKLPRDPYVTEFVTRTVPNGSYLLYVDDPEVAEDDENYHPYSNYSFNGWYYLDENGVEKRFVTGGDGLTVLQDLDLYAKWSSNVLKAFTVYFALDEKDNKTGADGADGIPDEDTNGNIIYVADPITGSTLAGTSRTFDAKGDTALYPAYRDGYYPHAVSHTIVVSIDDPDNQGANTFTFLYTPSAPVPYTVKYLIEGTNTPVPGTTQKYVEDNTKAMVTENFVAVSGYMPDEFQKTLVVRPGGENTLIFWYKQDIIHALYQVNHYIQNLDGKTWSRYDTNTITGDIGTAYSAAPFDDIHGYVFSATETDKYNITEKKNGFTGETLHGEVGAYANGHVTGTLTDKGMQLNLYYTRVTYPYQVYFLEYGTNVELKATVNGSAVYGQRVPYTADSVIFITDEGIEFELYDTEPETKYMDIDVDALTNGTVAFNKLIFYYTRCTQDLTVTKKVTGNGADPNQEFNFTVIIDPKYEFHQDSYAYGVDKYITPKDGVLSFKLKAGQSITIQDLPTAEYTITEVNLPAGYYADFDTTRLGEQTSAEIVLDRDVVAVVNCTNIYDPAKLTITKTVSVVEEDGNIPEVADFEFTITVPTGVTGSYAYTVDGKLADNPAKVEYGKITITLQNGQTATFLNLPLGNYTVTETDYSAFGYDSNYKVTGNSTYIEGCDASVTLKRSDSKTVEFMNKFPVGDLVIGKTVTKEFFDTVWTGDEFTFTVERTTVGRPLVAGNQYKVELDGVEQNATVAVAADGKLVVKISFNKADAEKLDEAEERNDSVEHVLTIKNLPAGTYAVTEGSNTAYNQSAKTFSGLTIPTELTEAQFTNQLIRPVADLSLSKTLEGAEGYTGELPMHTLFTFTFEATLQPPADDIYNVVYSPAVFTNEDGSTTATPTTVEMKDGKFTLQIQSGQTVTIENLPIDTYQITEATVPKMANKFYHNSSAVAEKIDKDEDGNLRTQIQLPANGAAVHCVNTYPVDNADLTIVHNGAEPGQIFVYEVKNNTTNEIITVTVTGNVSTTICDLPFGDYTVTQKNNWSWRYGNLDEVQNIVHRSADSTVEFSQSWIDYWLGGCSNLLKNIFGGS